uniref:GH26 domain-containing protein n=1 Tax=Octactis speculum TaxID=3111310 RepID=A0A7S2CZF4_9STRA|mmetsp:Transcript_41197/g.56138  ORF Transcript_41197/g.56138 Transcript_41197/m.56138 type:complete len:156 (+) Transcript_41197:2-469(+)
MFCPSSVSSSSVSNFREYYPGNNTVDIVGFDRYSTEHDFIDKMKADCREMKNFSVHEGKLLAVAEVGITGGIQDITNNPSWFHSDFSSVIRDECDTAAYALTFSNYKSDHYWIPLKGQETYRGFKKMYEGSNTVFLSGELWAKSSYSVYVQKLLS